MKNLSSLVTSVPASPTTMMMQRGRELKAAGKDVVSLAGGEPDFDTPRHIVEAGFAAIQAGDTHYPPSPGTPALLKAIVEKLKREMFGMPKSLEFEKAAILRDRIQVLERYLLSL